MRKLEWIDFFDFFGLVFGFLGFWVLVLVLGWDEEENK